jgi:hypothetical protein
MNIDREIAALAKMTAKQLRRRHVELFGEEARSGNRQWLFRRNAWRMQALREGDLSERVRRRAMELARDADLRIRPPNGPIRQPAAFESTQRLRINRDARLPMPGAVQDDQEVPHQPGVVEGLHANQAMDHLAAKPAQLGGINVPEEVIQRVGMRNALLAASGQTIEVLQRDGTVQLEADLPAGAELQQEQRQPRPHHESPVVDDHGLESALPQIGQPAAQLGEEVPDRLGQRPAQGYRLFPRRRFWVT